MIAAAGEDDAALLAALHKASFDRPWSETELLRLLQNPAALALVSENGFILAWNLLGEAEILTVAVTPEARLRGEGSSLVSAMCALAAMRGAGVMHLEVAEDNVGARTLYAKLGFVEAGRRPAYYAWGADALIMRRNLPL